MKPWEIVGRTRTPDGTELTLTRHTSEYLIQANGQSLMSSRMHGSEDSLGTLGCRRASLSAQPCVLVGGLGMGFTLRAALDTLPASATVIVAELVAAVVEWNRGELGALANHPLEDPRVGIEGRDVTDTIRFSPARFDAILLDVDNGPAALTTSSNHGLYDAAGLSVARTSLKAGGVLAIWSARDDRAFERRLGAAGFLVQRELVRGRATKRGPRHTILLGHNGSGA